MKQTSCVVSHYVIILPWAVIGQKHYCTKRSAFVPYCVEVMLFEGAEVW
jgi:hypothetical protein